MKISLFFAVCLAWFPAIAYGVTERHQRLAVGQGISSPDHFSPVNFTNGFVFQNPAGAASFQGAHVTAEGDTGNDTKGIGAEVGVGNGSAGAGLGYYKGCQGTGCGRFGAIGGLATSYFALGGGVHESKVYSAGLILGRGFHRFGFQADLQGATVTAASATLLGVGYSYNKGGLTVAVDAARRTRAGAKTTTITPGLTAASEFIAVTVNYDAHFGDDRAAFQDNFWFGVGLVEKSLRLAVYRKFMNTWSAALSYLF